MYAGKLMECAAAEALFENPRHPYTQALMQSLPSMHAHGEPLTVIPGRPPDPAEPLPGCPFAPRCNHAEQVCRETPIAAEETAPGHSTACTRVRMGTL
jgi:oligopeptide/dipeptide ABC transporter ATP-binding protein